MPQDFTAPSARLASRLHAFATNLHESCGLCAPPYFFPYLSCDTGILSQIDMNSDRIVPYAYCSVIRTDTRDNLK